MHFIGSGDNFYVATEQHCQSWIASLPNSHRKLLTTIRIMSPMVLITPRPFWTHLVRVKMMRLYVNLLLNFTLPYGVAPWHFEYYFDFERRQHWISPS